MQTQIVVFLFPNILSNWYDLHDEHLETSPLAFWDTVHSLLFFSTWLVILTVSFAGYTFSPEPL